MKRNIFHIILTVTFLLSACGGNTLPPQPTVAAGTLQSIPVMDDSTATPSPLPTATQTTQPAATLTASITPLPTIPTFTPTFDARTIVTVTPASPAECPKEDPTLTPDFQIRTRSCWDTKEGCLFSGTENEILDFLNHGGSIKSVIQKLSKADFGGYFYGKSKGFAYQDITGDSVSELIFEDFSVTQRIHIFYCEGRKYKIYPSEETEVHQQGTDNIYSIEDMNLNGLPEIVIVDIGGCSGACFGATIYEWNGEEFMDRSPYAGTTGFDSFQMKDFDHNGTKEFILRGDRPCIGCFAFETPWRYKTTVYIWNGQTYAPLPEKFDPPVYRYQAIEDADRLVMEGKFAEALPLYQDAIFSDKLEWWSHERWEYELNVSQYSYSSIKPTFPPLPAPDDSEYPRLAAYAYYRIMLLHVVKGYESDAGTVYKTLQQKFSNDQYGYPYAEMATSFWNEYQSSHDLTSACAKAIQYTVEHPDLLTPLGGPSQQDYNYKSEDVCPFR